MNIDGVTAIVTGGASGLGAATVEALRAGGARVAIFDLNVELGEETAARTGASFYACDIANATSATDAIAAATTELGTPAILVNCAGIGPAARVVGREGPMDLALFERVIRVNLIGTFNMIRLVGAAMSVAAPDGAGNRGVIVSTSSVAAFEGQVGQAAYAASKGGIAALTLPVAREFARFGIRVLTVAPGLFRTPLLEGLPQEAQDALGAAIPYPARLGEPSEFAQLVLAMIGNDYLNGEIVRLDGALRMQPR